MPWPGPQDDASPLPPGRSASTTPPSSLYDALSPWTILFLALACLILYQIATAALWNLGHPLIGLVMSPVAGIVLPVLFIVRRLGLSARAELRLERLPADRLWHVVWIILSALPLSYALGALNSRIWNPSPEHLEFYQALVPHDVMSFLGGLLAVIVLAPLGEEIVFRGLGYEVLVRRLSPPSAILITAVLFGAAHGAPWLLLPIIFLGLLLGVIRWLTDSLTATWLGHGLFNLAAFTELTWTGDVGSTRLESWSTHPAVLVLSGIALAMGLVSLVRLVRRPAPAGAAPSAYL